MGPHLGLGHSWDRAWVCPGFSGHPRSKGTTQRMESLCPGPAPQPGARPCVGPRPSPLTSPWAWRLMFCGWAPVTATQDSLRLHSQWPLSSARGHSAFLVQLRGRGAVLDWCPSVPGLGQGCTPRFWAGPRPWALTGPQRHTSRSRGPVSSGSERSWRSWHTPAREAGTPEGIRAASMTMASSQRGPPPRHRRLGPSAQPHLYPLSLRSLNTDARLSRDGSGQPRRLDLARDQLAPGSKKPRSPWLWHLPGAYCISP